MKNFSLISLLLAVSTHLGSYLALGDAPFALHGIAVAEPGGEVVITLDGFHGEGKELAAVIRSVPESGSVHHLTQVYSKHGVDPKKGEQVTESSSIKKADARRVVYARPSFDNRSPQNGEMWGRLTFTVTDGATESASAASVYLVPPGGGLFGSDFTESPDGWTVCQDGGQRCKEAKYSPTNRGILNRYISGEDLILHKAGNVVGDDVRWYFKGPPRYQGNFGVAYRGKMEFILGAFGGNFGNESMINPRAHIVELYCAQCNQNTGILLAFPLNYAKVESLASTGAVKFEIELHEEGGWVKDPKNVLNEWLSPSKCEMISVLSNLSEVRILGDITQQYESIGLDSFLVKQPLGTSQIPLCAQSKPDASICTC